MCILQETIHIAERDISSNIWLQWVKWTVTSACFTQKSLQHPAVICRYCIQQHFQPIISSQEALSALQQVYIHSIASALYQLALSIVEVFFHRTTIKLVKTIYYKNKIVVEQIIWLLQLHDGPSHSISKNFLWEDSNVYLSTSFLYQHCIHNMCIVTIVVTKYFASINNCFYSDYIGYPSTHGC